MKITNRTSLLALFLTGCSESELPPLTADPPEVYEFESRFQHDGAAGASSRSSVSYSGQTMRHVLIEDLSTYIGSLQERLDSDPSFDPGKVEAALLSYYEFDSTIQGQDSIDLTTTPKTLQNKYDDIATDKNLVSKIAGNDSGDRDHKDYSTEFYGWADASIADHGGSIESPDGLVRAFFATLENNAERKADGDEAFDSIPVHVTPSGLDLQELTEKFLLGAVAFAQASDDYLDEGLESDNMEAEEGAPFTPLEHAWDEGFGYFGASRDYLTLDVDDVAQGPAFDTDDDGRIDLLSEYTFGPASYAAKRDSASASGTTFAKDAMTAFIEGRYLIASSGQPVGLRDSADKAILAWEKALAASSIHYINELLADMTLVGDADYDFVNHAKHFSELKGLALSFQFNPRSPLTEKQFKSIHQLIGDRPLLEEGGDLDDYADALANVRETLGEVYDLESDDIEQW